MNDKSQSSIPTGCLIALLVTLAFGGILAVVAVLCGLGGFVLVQPTPAGPPPAPPRVVEPMPAPAAPATVVEPEEK